MTEQPPAHLVSGQSIARTLYQPRKGLDSHRPGARKTDRNRGTLMQRPKATRKAYRALR